MFAVIDHKGNQYKVEAGREYKIDLLDTEDKEITFSNVLLVSDDKETKVGAPYVAGITVLAENLGLARGEKITGIKFHAKKRYKRNLGHKQDYTLVKILSINC